MGARRCGGVLATVLAATLLVACRSDGNDSGAGPGLGLAGTPGFDGRTIKVGLLSAFTGSSAAVGKAIATGHRVLWRSLNEEHSGIAGKFKVELVIEDSQSTPQAAVQSYNKIHNQVAMFGEILGTDSVAATLPLLKADGHLAQPASLDAAWVRQPNLLPVGTPDQIQMINAAAWYVQDGGGSGQRLCSMRPDDAYGRAGQDGIDFAARDLGFPVAATATFRSGDQDFAGPVAQLKDAKCDAVFLAALAPDTGKVLSTASQLGFGAQWITLAPGWDRGLVKSPVGSYAGDHLVVVADGADWNYSSASGTNQLPERLAKFEPDEDTSLAFSIGFGYSAAVAVSKVLEKAVELGDLSREGLVKASARLGAVSLGGLTGEYHYGPADTRSPPRHSTIFKVNTSTRSGLQEIKASFASDAAKKFEFR